MLWFGCCLPLVVGCWFVHLVQLLVLFLIYALYACGLGVWLICVLLTAFVGLCASGCGCLFLLFVLLLS